MDHRANVKHDTENQNNIKLRTQKHNFVSEDAFYSNHPADRTQKKHCNGSRTSSARRSTPHPQNMPLNQQHIFTAVGNRDRNRHAAQQETNNMYENTRAILCVAIGRTKRRETYEFHIAGAGADVSLLVLATGRAGVATVRGAVLAHLRGVTGTRRSGRTRTRRLRAVGTLQRGGNDLRGQMQVGAQVLDAIVGQVPANWDKANVLATADTTTAAATIA